MKWSITTRIFSAILAATALATATLFLVMQWSIHRGFLRYLETMDRVSVENAATTLETLLEDHESLEFLRTSPSYWSHFLLRRSVEDPRNSPPPPAETLSTERDRPGLPEAQRPPGPPPPHHRLSVLATDGSPILGKSLPQGQFAKPLYFHGRIVGYVGMQPPDSFLDAGQLRFLSRQKSALVFSAIAVVGVAALFSFPLARRLVRPIRSLAAGTRSLASGQYDTRVSVIASDELGRLARDFNTLALTLEKNEQSRRRWVADISHELRTPLAVLCGEVESLLDGVRPLNAESLASLHAEVLHLNRLVDDLYQLSLSDLGALSYQRTNVSLGMIIEHCVERLHEEFTRKSLQVQVHLPNGGRPPVFGDTSRLAQLFTNVLDNAIKYTDSPGRIEIRLQEDDGQAKVDIEDSAPAVPGPDLEKLFDRLYRVEDSRSRSSGGAGLGLAITKSIVEAHQGTIQAFHSHLGGLHIRVVLPTEEAPG